jgi:hypothetical protein
MNRGSMAVVLNDDDEARAATRRAVAMMEWWYWCCCIQPPRRTAAATIARLMSGGRFSDLSLTPSLSPSRSLALFPLSCSHALLLLVACCCQEDQQPPTCGQTDRLYRKTKGCVVRQGSLMIVGLALGPLINFEKSTRVPKFVTSERQALTYATFVIEWGQNHSRSFMILSPFLCHFLSDLQKYQDLIQFTTTIVIKHSKTRTKSERGGELVSNCCFPRPSLRSRLPPIVSAFFAGERRRRKRSPP